MPQIWLLFLGLVFFPLWLFFNFLKTCLALPWEPICIPEAVGQEISISSNDLNVCEVTRKRTLLRQSLISSLHLREIVLSKIMWLAWSKGESRKALHKTLFMSQTGKTFSHQNCLWRHINKWRHIGGKVGFLSRAGINNQAQMSVRWPHCHSIHPCPNPYNLFPQPPAEPADNSDSH